MGLKPNEFDLLVIGSGSAGSAAAEIANASGHSVAMIEKGKVGGDCPNYACVPTKALLRSATIFSLLKRADQFGLRSGNIEFDWSQIMARKEYIVQHTGAASAEKRYQEVGIAFLKGVASFEDEHSVLVDGSVLRGKRTMIATGSRPTMPHLEGIIDVEPLNSIQAIGLRKLPSSIIIIGGGPVACEFAQLFSTFGVQVTLLQKSKRILPQEEPELTSVIHQALEHNGVSIMAEVDVMGLAKDGGKKKVWGRLQGKTREFVAQEILIAVGRTGQLDDLNLKAVGVETEKGKIRTNECLQTTNPHIYAGGDVTGPHLYTHFAHYQGTLAGLNMFSSRPRLANYRVVPHVIFTDPEIASVGMTEEQARWSGRKVITGKFEISALGKALVTSEERGMVKIVADAGSGEILGGHIASPTAGEMIHEFVAAMTSRAAVKDIADAIHAYPSFSEGIKIAAGKGVNALEQLQPRRIHSERR
ncbi:MAG: NAD(P)/FAD-dependent oxidoreductase [Acidobacteria bacterium]|nr:NAD(P)/FAD-dependent oxidoreductase [Acidobacteriota bacterium]